jgi:ribose transport system permease protein
VCRKGDDRRFGTRSDYVGSAGLLGVVSIGQMLVITSGEGAVDLSIPSVMTLSGFVVTSLINGEDSRLILGLIAALVLGLIVGLANALIVNRFRIPPIVATLAVGYILTTATLILNRGFQTYAISPMLGAFASGRLFGTPTIFILALILTAAASYLLHSTVYGKSLSAVGQNRQSAYLAGVGVAATSRIAYVLSSVLAAIGGMLLSGRVSGAFLEMGNPYTLQSIGAGCHRPECRNRNWHTKRDALSPTQLSSDRETSWSQTDPHDGRMAWEISAPGRS